MKSLFSAVALSLSLASQAFVADPVSVTTLHRERTDGLFTICNRTQQEIYLVIAYWNTNVGGLWSEGWFHIKPGDCQGFFGDDTMDGHRMFYAEAVGGELWTDTYAPLCVNPTQAFKHKYETGFSSEECPAGWVRKGFRLFPDTNLDLNP